MYAVLEKKVGCHSRWPGPHNGSRHRSNFVDYECDELQKFLDKECGGSHTNHPSSKGVAEQGGGLQGRGKGHYKLQDD